MNEQRIIRRALKDNPEALRLFNDMARRMSNAKTILEDHMREHNVDMDSLNDILNQPKGESENDQYN